MMNEQSLEGWRHRPIPVSGGEFNMFKDLIFEKSGIKLKESKIELLKTRLSVRIRAMGLQSFSEYYHFITQDRSGRELVAMLDAISTNVTSFFREIVHFKYLEEVLAPAVAARSGSQIFKEIRGWSAGCSSGEEPYSMAITLLECPAVNGPKWDIRILATDISTEMLERAQAGEYPAEKLDSVPGRLLAKYFDKIEADGVSIRKIKPIAAKLAHFRRFNLMASVFPFKRKFHFIFCRNVMIYFDRPTQQQLISRFFDALEPGGALMIGHSESLTGLNHSFKYVKPTIYLKPE